MSTHRLAVVTEEFTPNCPYVVLTAVPWLSLRVHRISSALTPSGEAVNVAFARRLGGPSTSSSVTLCASSHSLFIYYHKTHEQISHTNEKTHLIKDPFQILIIILLVDEFRLSRFLLLFLLDFLGRSSFFLGFGLGLRGGRFLFRHRLGGVGGRPEDVRERLESAHLIGVEREPDTAVPSALNATPVERTNLTSVPSN